MSKNQEDLLLEVVNLKISFSRTICSVGLKNGPDRAYTGLCYRLG